MCLQVGKAIPLEARAGKRAGEGAAAVELLDAVEKGESLDPGTDLGHSNEEDIIVQGLDPTVADDIIHAPPSSGGAADVLVRGMGGVGIAAVDDAATTLVEEVLDEEEEHIEPASHPSAGTGDIDITDADHECMPFLDEDGFVKYGVRDLGRITYVGKVDRRKIKTACYLRVRCSVVKSPDVLPGDAVGQLIDWLVAGLPISRGDDAASKEANTAHHGGLFAPSAAPSHDFSTS